MTLATLLLRLSEGGEPAILWGRTAKPYFGRDFDRLQSRGALVEQAPATEWDVCSDCECGLSDRPVRRVRGLLVATCPLDHARDEPLDIHDLRSFTINAAALVLEIAAGSGFTGAPAELVPGVWYLGLTPTQRALFVAVTRSAVSQPGLIATMRLAQPVTPTTLVGPAVEAADQLRFAEAGIHFVPVSHAFGERSRPMSLDFSRLQPLSAAAPRLVLNRPRRTLTLDGREFEIPPRSFALLWLMAETVAGGGGVVTHQRIESRLWGKQPVARTATADAARDLREALKVIAGDGEAPGELIETRSGQGYLLNLPADAIRLLS